MSWLFRPSALILVSAALALGAAAVVFWPGEGAANRALPRPVPEGDQEIAWLNPATSAVAWERFVSAVRRVQAEQPEAGWQLDESNAFPLQTTAAPEVSLWQRGGKARLW